MSQASRGVGEYSLVLLDQLRITVVTDSNLLSDAEVRESHAFRGAFLVKDLSTVSTVVFAVREGERVATSEANVRVYPLWGSLSINHGRAGRS